MKLGDGRKSLERARPREFGLITIDAFTSDAVPVHLLTREAVTLYLQRLRPGGLLLFNISNRFVDFEPVLGNLANDLRLPAASSEFRANDAQAERRWDSSTWAVMTRDPARSRGWAGAPASASRRARCGPTTSRTCSARCAGAR